MHLIDSELEQYARCMAAEYPKARNRENALIAVLHQYPDAPVNILRAMWESIDWYVDANE